MQQKSAEPANQAAALGGGVGRWCRVGYNRGFKVTDMCIRCREFSCACFQNRPRTFVAFANAKSPHCIAAILRVDIDQVPCLAFSRVCCQLKAFPASGQPFFKKWKIAHIAEWRSGLITQRSMDRNHAPLILRCFLSADALGGLLLKINPRQRHKPSIHT